MAVRYCALKAIAEDIRAQVDKVQRRLLFEECQLFKDLTDGVRVIDPKDYWLSQDADACKAYYAAQDRELRAAGVKPPEMEDEFCPALVAEYDARKARRAIIEALAPLVGIKSEALYGEEEEKFFGLALGLILNA
jgi:hypothetical protein